MNNALKLNALQIEEIVNKLVPLIAAPEDEAFFRFVLTEKAANCSSAEFSVFVGKLLNRNQEAANA